MRKKNWTEENATNDYQNKCKKKRCCRVCRFGKNSSYDTYCTIKNKDIIFGWLISKMCKYFNNKYKDEVK